jgi:hypothetical protein
LADGFFIGPSAFTDDLRLGWQIDCLFSGEFVVATTDVDSSGFAKSTLFASRTLIRSSKSSLFLKRAETSSEPDKTATR